MSACITVFEEEKDKRISHHMVRKTHLEPEDHRQQAEYCNRQVCKEKQDGRENPFGPVDVGRGIDPEGRAGSINRAANHRYEPVGQNES